MNININNLYPIMVQYRENLKLFHFTSKRYSEHKASDDALSKFDSKFDEFWEQYQGQTGRINIKSGTSIKLILYSHEELIMETSKLIKILEDIPIDYNLANVRDEIVGLLYNFIYLLSFL
jgi:hypothetical protein